MARDLLYDSKDSTYLHAQGKRSSSTMAQVVGTCKYLDLLIYALLLPNNKTKRNCT